jgi:hypothetical protein
LRSVLLAEFEIAADRGFPRSNSGEFVAGSRKATKTPRDSDFAVTSSVPCSPVRTALTLLAIDLYAARDVLGHGDRSWCLTLASGLLELGTPPFDGVAADGQVG